MSWIGKSKAWMNACAERKWFEEKVCGTQPTICDTIGYPFLILKTVSFLLVLASRTPGWYHLQIHTGRSYFGGGRAVGNFEEEPIFIYFLKIWYGRYLSQLAHCLLSVFHHLFLSIGMFQREQNITFLPCPFLWRWMGYVWNHHGPSRILLDCL